MKTTMRGFSLIELMIAVTLGLVAVAAVGSVFIYGSRNYKQDDRLSRMQDELRFAMAQMSQDIEMAGFWAQVANPVQNIENDVPTPDEDCGPTTDGGAMDADNNWLFNERRSGLMTLGNATAAQAAARFPCINAGEFVAGTDVLGITRLGGTDVVETTAGKVYLLTNGVQSTLYVEDAAYAPALPESAYEYKPSVWFVRNYTNVAGDGIPCLTRKVLVGDDMNSECIASGIQDLQLEFGLDSDGNGVVNNFVEYAAAAAPTAQNLAQVTAIRVHLLARSIDPDPNVDYKNMKTYQLGNKQIAATQDRYYRRSLSSVVLVRNQAYRQAPFALPSS